MGTDIQRAEQCIEKSGARLCREATLQMILCDVKKEGRCVEAT